MSRAGVVVGVLLASAAVAWAVACSTRQYALCIEHPEEDPARCGDGAAGPSDAAPDQADSSEGGGSDGGCPSDMVAIPVGKGFCIDKTEVTVADYRAFLDGGPKASNQKSCGWKTKPGDFRPRSHWDTLGPDDAGIPGQLLPGREMYPVLDVDWCSAYEYCASRGKHLCGTIGGGPASRDDDGGEWAAACSHGDDGYRYPWGNDGDAAASCNGAIRAKSLDASPALEKVGAVASCMGPYPGLVDLAGNAAEWIDLCDDNDAMVEQQLCDQKGGSFREEDYLTCLGASGKSSRNGEGNPVPEVGIRCCK